MSPQTFPNSRRTRLRRVGVKGVVPCLLIFAFSGGAPDDGFTTIDVPGARFTEVAQMNARGEIVGDYLLASGRSHGFLRAPDGTITTFDAPKGGLGITTWAVNSRGQVTGAFQDANDVSHGFVRSRNGEVATFDFPMGFRGLEATGISDDGVVSGTFVATVGGVNQFTGYVRAEDGTITTFLVGSTFPYTIPQDISPSGRIVVGDYRMGPAPVAPPHGFMIVCDGAAALFDVPGGTRTVAWSVNDAGDVAGNFTDADGKGRVFKRSFDGTFTTLDMPGSTTTQTVPASHINAAGAVAGFYVDLIGLKHGLVWAPDGTATTIDFPGAKSTTAQSISESGIVIGGYTDASNVAHGFVYDPPRKLRESLTDREGHDSEHELTCDSR